MGEKLGVDTIQEPIGVDKDTLDLIEAKMKEFAIMYHAQYHRVELDSISLLQDALEALGLTVDDLSTVQLTAFADSEGELFREYLVEDENEFDVEED